MKKAVYDRIEQYMLSCAGDLAHEREHIYRVLYTALDIARTEPEANADIVVCSCLLHDVARRAEAENASICHARAGAEQARLFLLAAGFPGEFAERVADCIRTCRFRSDAPPESIEAKILFDADKIDATGAMGIARAILYCGVTGRPLYAVLPDGSVSDGVNDRDDRPFLAEYKYKLEGLYHRFYTRRGEEIAAGRRRAADSFYEALLAEARSAHEIGRALIDAVVRE